MVDLLNSIPDDVLYIIFSKLYNYEISVLFSLNKRIRELIKRDFFIKYLLRRKHPLVFNNNDLFCKICNLNICRLNDKNKLIIRCNHF